MTRRSVKKNSRRDTGLRHTHSASGLVASGHQVKKNSRRDTGLRPNKLLYVGVLTPTSKKTPGEILDCDRRILPPQDGCGPNCQKKLQARYWIATRQYFSSEPGSHRSKKTPGEILDCDICSKDHHCHPVANQSKKTPGEILDCDERQCCWLEIELGFACQKKLQARYWIATPVLCRRNMVRRSSSKKTPGEILDCDILWFEIPYDEARLGQKKLQARYWIATRYRRVRRQTSPPGQKKLQARYWIATVPYCWPPVFGPEPHVSKKTPGEILDCDGSFQSTDFHLSGTLSKKTPGEILDCDESGTTESTVRHSSQKKLQARYWIATFSPKLSFECEL